MQTSIFSPDLNLLSKLRIQEATEVFGRLLWCEGARLGLVNIVVSGDVNSADGGIDAKAEHVGGKGRHSFHYQIKTGAGFRPWQAATIKRELFGSPTARPSKRNLGPAVRRCLDTHGTYVLVCFGHDLLAEDHSAAVSLLQAAFRTIGYKSPRVEVWGVRQIANMIERYPSLCLDLGGLGDARFQTVASWAANGDMAPKVHLGAPQSDFILRLQTVLSESATQHARVIGEPGIGKTRLVLEAIRELPLLSSKAIYVPQAEFFQASRLFFELLKEDREYSVVLVIDECDDQDRASIFGALRGRPRTKLVTIDHGPELSSDGLMEVIRFPALEAPQVEEILREYVGKTARVSNWVPWCEGSARVAHAVGDNLKRNPDDILRSPAIVPIWDRFVLGYNRVKGEQSERLLTIVRHIALFQKFGARKPVEAEGRFVADLARRVDPGVTPGAFEIAVSKLVGRRILQGSHTLRLVPRALHIHLWKQWWDIHGASVDLGALLDEMPETLRRWFLAMLIYSNGVPSAQAAIKEVLRAPNGPFTSKEFVRSESGSSFLSVMAEADPAATLGVLEHTLGSWPRSDIAQLSGARQTLVFALEKIAVWGQHFRSAAYLLTQLCFGERATNSNNARGTLQGLFALRGAPTQASAMERLSFVRALIDDSDRFRRFLGLDLAERLLSDEWRSRIVGVEYQGLAPPVEFWVPRVWNDLFEPRRRALRLLLDRSDPTDPEWQRSLSTVIVKSTDDLLRYKPLAEIALSAMRAQLTFEGGDGQALVKMLLHRIKHPYQGMPSHVTKQLQEILDATGAGTFAQRFNRFVTYDTYEENYDIDPAGGVVESALPTQRVTALAREFAREADVRLENLGTVIRSGGTRIAEFGQQVAEISLETNDLTEEMFNCAESLRDVPNVGFLSGYLEGLRRIDPRRWEERAIKLLAESAPARWKIRAVVFSGFSPKVVSRLLELFSARSATASDFHSAGWRHGNDLPISEIERICKALNESGDAEGARAAVQIASYRLTGAKEGGSVDLLWPLLTNAKVFERSHDSMASHYWKTLAASFRKQCPEREIELLGSVFKNLSGSGELDSFSGVGKTVLEICKLHPRQSWLVVAEALEDAKLSWAVSYWLGEPVRPGIEAPGDTRPLTPIDSFEPQQVLDWILEKPSRAELVVQALPKSLETGRGGDLSRGFIEAFGARSDQARSLMNHFDAGLRRGPDSQYYSRQRDAARSWLAGPSSANVREWLGDYISMLTRIIEEAVIREERSS